MMTESRAKIPVENMTTLLDGKKLANKIKKEISKKIEKSQKPYGLAAVLIGDNPSSKTYLKLKDKDCTEVGIEFENFHLSSDVSMDEVLDLLNELNQREEFDGIIVQLPVPNHLERKKILKSIDSEKDVDGLHPYNVGKLWTSDYSFQEDLLPCTPKGIITMLERYDIDVGGMDTVIINRSDLVGKPLAKLLLDRNSTVTICHSRTNRIGDHTSAADLLITAVGRRPDFTVTEEMIKEDAVVVDVGMNYIEDRLYGDVEFEEVKDKTSHITPVPGGVGPMTRAMLLENVMIAGGIEP